MRNDTRQGQEQHYDYAAGSTPSYRSGLGYLLIGGGIGATLALLFAPKAGSELRGDIADVTRKGYDTARDKARVLNEKSGELVHTVKDKADSVYNFAARKGRSGIDTASERAASAAGDLIEKTGDLIEKTENKIHDREEGFRRAGNIG